MVVVVDLEISLSRKKTGKLSESCVLARVTARFRLEYVDIMTRSRVWLPGSCIGNWHAE